MNVRPLTRADLDQVMHLLEGVIEPSDPGQLDPYLSAPSAANRFGSGLVAEDHGKVVGVVAGAGIKLTVAGLEVSEEEITQRIGLLDVLAVHPGHRRTGVGSLLRDHLLDRLRDVGHCLVMANLAVGRRDLVPIYAAWGWTVGNPGAGIAIQIGSEPLALAEDPGTRVAWTALAPEVRLDSTLLPGASIVAGVFT
ncbi:hypothetical protein SRB17_82830 [Streptomyces sp. RB17]|uniref:GNAT family N-acetyltransferase n=1 Tax=Streptomyces sp. RB17 TaxID=2585197 RepID=UPI00130C0303|nr:GNAT family N-acetyltransferase [Streptomyces sp. RB17]MQY40252.1 hypothetical protein [Streptomyces sp. RB17]